MAAGPKRQSGLENLQLPAGSEVRVVKQQDGALRNVCVALAGQTDSDCRWGRSTGLETKAAWAHDSGNPAGDDPPK